MEYRRFDLSLTFICNYFEYGPMGHNIMLCKEFYYSALVATLVDRAEPVGQVCQVTF